MNSLLVHANCAFLSEVLRACRDAVKFSDIFFRTMLSPFPFFLLFLQHGNYVSGDDYLNTASEMEVIKDSTI